MPRRHVNAFSRQDPAKKTTSCVITASFCEAAVVPARRTRPPNQFNQHAPDSLSLSSLALSPANYQHYINNGLFHRYLDHRVDCQHSQRRREL